MHHRFWTELGQAFDKLSQEPDVRAVVLASSLPKLFSAGIDCMCPFYVSDRHSPLTDCIDAPGYHLAIQRLPASTSPSIAVTALSGSSTSHEDVGRRALPLRNHITTFQHAISAPERCPYPVIVATHGVAYGLSIDIIAACDVRYTASNTVFSIKVRTPSDVPCALLLAR